MPNLKNSDTRHLLHVFACKVLNLDDEDHEDDAEAKPLEDAILAFMDKAHDNALTALLEAMPEKPVMPTLEEYMKAVKYAEAHYKYDDMFDYAYKTAIKDVTAIIEERLKT